MPVTTLRRRRHRGALGMTLIELMIGMVVSTIVLAAVAAISIAQNRATNSGKRLRARQNNARFAIDYLERTVRMGGFGIDPQFAFDFDFYRCGAGLGTAANYASAGCQAVDPARDSTTGPDELVVYRRNPSYQVGKTVGAGSVLGQAWRITAAAAGQLTLEMRKGDAIGLGQVLQLVCPGARAHTYVTVSNSLGPVTADNEYNVTLAAHSVDSPFRQNDAISSTGAAACFGGGTAVAYRVERSHFFIMSDTHANLPSDAKGNSGTPQTYLVLDTGVDRNLDGTIDEKDLVPVAADIVDLQVAYVLQNGSVWGAGANGELTAVLNRSPLQTSYATLAAERPCGSISADIHSDQSFGQFREPCLLDKGSEDPYRDLDFTGNIRAVRISIVARTGQPLESQQSELFFPPGDGLSLENRPSFDVTSALPAGFAPFYPSTQFRRRNYVYETLQTTVNIPNMRMSGHFMF